MDGQPEHDLLDFVRQQEESMQAEFKQISKRVREDPGTAGDSIEACWKELLEKWLPSYFKLRNKGRILFENAQTSPQIDVVVLSPAYPPFIESKLHYLSCGVVAAFECKTTLKREHIFEAVKTAAEVRQNSRQRTGSPYLELVPEIAYGLIANTHDWKKEGSDPVGNITSALWEAEKQYVKHPRQCLDYICVADLACWSTTKVSKGGTLLGGDAVTVLHPCMLGESKYAQIKSGTTDVELVGRDPPVKSPMFYFLQCLIERFAWEHKDMRRITKYFSRMRLRGQAKSRSRSWEIDDVYSFAVAKKVKANEADPKEYSEWRRMID